MNKINFKTTASKVLLLFYKTDMKKEENKEKQIFLDNLTFN